VSGLSTSTGREGAGQRHLLLMLVGLSVVIVLYQLQRFGGNWTSGDTVRMATATRSIYMEGTLVPIGNRYEHGFNSQMVSVVLLNLTGISLEWLTTRVLPFMLGVEIVVAYATYSILTRDRWAALLGAFFLALQPEFLFTTMRGSHEKITWMLTLLALYLLARGFLSLPSPRIFAVWTGLVYLSAFALVTTNTFFASSFLAALALCFAAATGLSRLLWKESTRFSRLAYVAVSCSILIFVFMFYVYTPSLNPMYILKDAIDKVAALLLNVEMEAPFSVAAAGGNIGAGWVSVAAYLALSATSYLLALVSLIYWLVLARRLLKGQVVPSPVFLLWLFYAGFAAQLVLSVGTSGLGLLTSNLQVRLFPVFMLVVMPLAAMAIREASRLLSRSRLRYVFVPLAFLLVLWAAGAALLKATNEPLLSNHWIFRVRAEQVSLQWIGDRTRVGYVWLGLDRLRYAREDYSDPIGSRYDIFEPGQSARYGLVSSFEETRMLRLGVPQPPLGQENLVYDNGTAHAYHFRPRTPYQR